MKNVGVQSFVILFRKSFFMHILGCIPKSIRYIDTGIVHWLSAKHTSTPMAKNTTGHKHMTNTYSIQQTPEACQIRPADVQLLKIIRPQVLPAKAWWIPSPVARASVAWPPVLWWRWANAST